MKKLLYSIIISCFISTAFADVDFSQAIQNSSMPTDAEIRAVISQFNFNKEQQDALFKETKKKLRAMYTTQNASQTNAELNQYLNQVENGSMDKIIDPSMKRELLQGVSNMPKTSSTSSATSKVIYSTKENSQKGFRNPGYQHKGFQSKKQSD